MSRYLGVEDAPSLAAPNGEISERVLEDLLESQKLDDALGYGGVEAEPALVGTQSGVELAAVPWGGQIIEVGPQ